MTEEEMLAYFKLARAVMEQAVRDFDPASRCPRPPYRVIPFEEVPLLVKRVRFRLAAGDFLFRRDDGITRLWQQMSGLTVTGQTRKKWLKEYGYLAAYERHLTGRLVVARAERDAEQERWLTELRLRAMALSRRG